MILSLMLMAAMANAPRPISVTTTFNEDGSETVATVWLAADIYRNDAYELGVDYRTYMKARRKVGAGPHWKVWRDHEGYDWTRSSGTICRFRGEFGTCVSH